MRSLFFIRRVAAGENVQVGQYYDFNTKEILWSFPRLFNGTSALKNSTELKEYVPNL